MKITYRETGGKQKEIDFWLYADLRPFRTVEQYLEVSNINLVIVKKLLKTYKIN